VWGSPFDFLSEAHSLAFSFEECLMILVGCIAASRTGSRYARLVRHGATAISLLVAGLAIAHTLPRLAAAPIQLL
jgi:hypothetical protein